MNSESAIFLKVNYSAQEVNQGYWEVYRRLVLPQQLLAVFCVGFAVAQGYACVSIGLGDVFFAPQAMAGIEEGRLILILLLAGLGIPAVLCCLVTLIIHARVMNSYEARPNFHFPIVYVIGENGLNISFASGQGTLDWGHLKACVETAFYFCLVASPEDVFVLPKRCLSGEQEVTELRHLIVKKVRTYLRHNGRDLPINYEKHEIKEVLVDGEIYAGVAAGADSDDNGEGEIAAANASEPLVSELLKGESPLGSGLSLAVVYQSGEIQAAEKIFFFRKRLPALSLLYLSSIGWFMPSAFAISYIWGRSEMFWELFSNYGYLFALTLPVFAAHSLYNYLLVMGRARVSEEYGATFTFQLSEEGCGLSSGERYAVLSWWHFAEVWETKEAFMLLFGKQGRAMYVIPKRAFPERSGLAYVQNLLSRKVAKLLALD